MNVYRVLLNGENFLMTYSGQTKRMGFFTTRFVEATNEAEAETVAVSLLRQDENLRGNVLNTADDPPMIYVDEVEQVNGLQQAQGFTFFSGEDEE